MLFRAGSSPGQVRRKLGGLLVEGSGEHAGPVRAVIGLGLNVRMPDGHGRAIDQPWIDLAAMAPDVPPSRNAVAAALLAALDRKSVVEGKSVSVRVDLGGRRIIKKKTEKAYRDMQSTNNYSK